MNTAELAEHIATGHEMNKSQAKQVVEAVFAAIVQAASKGEEVSLPGFGKFKVAEREARQGRRDVVLAAALVRPGDELLRQRDGVVAGTVVADAFCHSMVRSLVGALVPVGDGRRDVDWPATVLTGAVRDPGVRVMPPHGLSLEEAVRTAESAAALLRDDAPTTGTETEARP